MKLNCFIIVKLLLLSLALFATSCMSYEQTIIKLSEEANKNPNVKQFIIDDLKTKKIIFISELHEEIDPILFLAENLQSFYDNGVRYLFLEGGLGSVPSDTNYGFLCLYPWMSGGLKYESIALAEAVKNLNATLKEEDKLKIIIPEEGLVTESTGEPHQIPKLLNSRDTYAFNTIVSVLDKSLSNEKAIIFYGGSHGGKSIRYFFKTGSSPFFTWVPFGAMLAKKYKQEFTSYYSIYFDSICNKPKLKENFPNLSIVTPNKLFNTTYSFIANNYDYIIINPTTTYGIFYQYMPIKENIEYIYKKLLRLENTIEKWENNEGNFRAQEKGQYLLFIYYLKLYFGNNFSYEFWNNSSSLKTALLNLDITKFNYDKIDSTKIQNLREYHKLMRYCGIEDFTNGANINTEKVITNMTLATKLLPEDIWSLFWLAYAQTEAKDYKTALTNWEVLFNNNLSTCLETLPYAYKKAAICAENLKQIEKAKKFINIAESLKNEHNIDVDIYYKNLN